MVVISTELDNTSREESEQPSQELPHYTSATTTTGTAKLEANAHLSIMEDPHHLQAFQSHAHHQAQAPHLLQAQAQAHQAPQ